jgi:hypothetical protein
MRKTLIIVLMVLAVLTVLPLTGQAANYRLIQPKSTVIVNPTPAAAKPVPTLTPFEVRYSGNYAVNYDLTNIAVAVAGATKNVSLAEIKSGQVKVDNITLPADVAEAIEQMLADQFTINIEAKHFGPLHKVTWQDNQNNPVLNGLVNHETGQVIVARLNGQASLNGQCAAISGVIAGGNLALVDNTPAINGSSTVGLIFGCDGFIAGAKATISWTANQIN